MASKKYVYPYRETFEFEGQIIDVKARTTRELIEKVNKRKAEISNALVDENVKLKDWIETWIKTYKHGKVSPGWERSIKSMLNASVPDEIGNLPMGKIRTTHAQQITNTAEGKSASYVHKLEILLTSLFDIAVKNKMIADNPMDLTEPVKGTKNKRRAITEAERGHILKLAETHRAGLFIKIMINCGLRPQEVAALQWRNVDLKKSIIKVEAAVKSDNQLGPPKSDSGYREVPIPDNFLPELKKGNPFDFVCTTATGQRHSSDSIRQMWKSFIYRLNVQMGCAITKHGALVPPYPVSGDLVMYCLRHTYGTDLIRADVNIYDVKELMGHSSVTVTEGYTHKTDETIKRAAEKINAFHKAGGKSGKSLENNPVSIGK